ncbi:MAG: peroxidase [Vicinamibacterales bacterium]
MEPLFLPDVELSNPPGPWSAAIRMMRERGAEYPQIWHLFAFMPDATTHLARFTQAVLRGPAPLSPGLRELIAAYTSARNHCPF